MEYEQKVEIKKDLERYVTKWLLNKANFLYIKDSSFIDFINKFSTLLFEARVHFDILEAAPFYLKDKDNLSFYSPTNHRHTFKNFNMPLQSLLYDSILIKDNIKTFEHSSFQEQLNMLITEQFELKNSAYNYPENAQYKLFQKFFLKYQDIIKTLDPNIFKDFLYTKINCDFECNLYKQYILEKKEPLAKKQDIEYIFFPFVFSNNILEKKNYLLEINLYKFKRKNIDLKAIIDDFYKKYGVNTNLNLNLFTLYDYFNNYVGSTYNEHYAYINPFELIKKYDQQIQNLLTPIKNKKDFIFQFLTILNQIQYESVMVQQKNLVAAIQITKGSKKQKYTLQEILQKEIKELQKHSSPEIEELIRILILLSNKIKNLKIRITNHTSLEDLDVNSCTEEEKDIISQYLTNYQFSNGKVTLRNLSTIYKKDFQILIDNFSLKQSSIAILSLILDDILSFYDTANTKFLKAFNSHFETIYSERPKTNINKILDGYQEDNFILQYKNEYNKFRVLTKDDTNWINPVEEEMDT